MCHRVQEEGRWMWQGITSDHIHLPVCLWIMDPHRRAPKKNMSHGNEMLLQDTMHRMQKDPFTNKVVCAKIQQAIGPHKDLTIVKRHKLQWYRHISCSSGLAKSILQGTVKEGRRGRKTTSGNGQAWSSPGPRGQWRTEKNGGNWLGNHL